MALEAARALVPWWVLPSAVAAYGIAAFLFAFALGACLFAFARRADRRDQPWPLRARALFPPRVYTIVALLALPTTLWMTLPAVWMRHLLPPGTVTLGAAVGALAGLTFWSRRLARLLGQGRWPLRRSLAAFATRVLVLFPHVYLAIAVAFAMPARFDLGTLALFAVTLAVLVGLARGGGFRIARAIGLAPAAPEGLAAAIAADAARAGILLKGVHTFDLRPANAYALPYASRIGFTRSALERVELKHLLAIAQHELTHLSEPARARRVRLMGILVLVPLLLAKPIVASRGLVALLLAFVAALLVLRLLRGRLRALETRADAGAKAAEAEQGEYARALTELHRVNLIPVVLRQRSTHPLLYDRLVALGAPPSYPRPPPPSRAASLGFLAAIILCAVVTPMWGSITTIFVREPPWLVMTLDGGNLTMVGSLARARHVERRYDDAATFYGAAAELAPRDPTWPAYEAMSLAAAGRIEEARRAVEEAERRGADEDLLADANARIAKHR